MKKLTVIGLDLEKQHIMSKLSDFGAVELIDQSKKLEDDFWKNTVVQDEAIVHAQELDQKDVCAQSALDLIDRFAHVHGPLFKTRTRIKRSELEAMEKDMPAVEAVIEDVLALGNEMMRVNERCNKLEADLLYLVPWINLDLPVDLVETKHCTIHRGIFPIDVNLEELVRQLDETLENVVLKEVSHTKELSYVTMISLKENDEAVLEIAKQFGFIEVSFGSMSGTPLELKAAMTEELKEQKKEIDRIQVEISKAVVMKGAIEAYYDIVSVESEKEKNRSKLLKTKETFILEGWIPERCIPDATVMLEQLDCHFAFSQAEEGETPPVLLENSAMVAPFESVTEMYALPAYGSFDPTKIFAVFYVVFFGMMLSDAAYGILMSVACFVVLKKYDLEGMAHKLIKLFFYCGLSTTFWGAMFGGWFGDIVTVVANVFFDKEVVIKPLWFNPIDDPVKLLLFSMALGVIHIFTGLGIKAYMDIKDGRWLDAIFDEGFWILTISGICVWLGGAMAIPELGGAGKWMTIVGVLGLLLTGGRKKKGFGKVIGGLSNVYNITSYLSDILSYSRILALGLATGVIAQVVNTMGSIFGGGIVGAIVLLLLFIFGHTLNIAINVLGAYVHTARLQYVEFFGKFYEDGGEPFEPMGNKTKYIRIENDK
ncbi:MAG: V-type ATP synthase subunit I [Firmicutes bacterium]|nr:V-type ATP synthase subunit I [Bacillota bacterium]